MTAKAVLLLNAFLFAGDAEDNGFSSTVGMSAVVEINVDGTELTPKPIDDNSPIVLRILETFPQSDGFRYRLAWYGLEPGEFFLTDYLQRLDGSPLDSSKYAVTVEPVLAPGQVLPNKLEIGESRRFGGYRTWAIGAGVGWVVVLLAILCVGRWKRGSQAGSPDPPMTLADRLRPLVDEAIAGKLDREQSAELEMTLVGLWRRRLSLDHAPAAELIALLRKHSDAGPLLLQLETWLHKPGDSSVVDVARLLEPYRDMPADSIDSKLVDS